MNHKKENSLQIKKHILIYNNDVLKVNYQEEFDYIKDNFCGNVVPLADFNISRCSSNSIIYLYGNINNIISQNDFGDKQIIIIEELSSNYENNNRYQIIKLGEVPINIHNVGVYFRKFFNSNDNYYDLITKEHQFQDLGISNKPGIAYRKGIYLTPITKYNDEIKFRLLRCSTNLSGPTDNFRKTDNEIVGKVNNVAQQFFKDNIELNHVLAQTYHNSITTDGEQTKERKAKIAVHSDKTKDMPRNALMAFCTFYENYCGNNFENNNELNSLKNEYDYLEKDGRTTLTKLRFKLKDEANNGKLVKKFDITLYPNSVFLMSLETNRLYTHEIVPSSLSINQIPVRMGYVIRCSNTNAVFKDNQTYIHKYNKYFKLEEPTKDGIEELKKMYMIENKTIEMVDYEDKFNFSMNKGDYMQPIL